MVQCLHQSNDYIKRKLGLWRAQKCIPLVGAISALTCAGPQTTPTHVRQYRAEYGILGKSGATIRHGAVFSAKQSLHQKEARVMKSPKMYSSNRCSERTYLCWSVNYPDSCKAVQGRVQNIGKSGATFRHGAVFAPKQRLHQKEAKAMESPKMYSSCRCNKRAYLWRSANYPDSCKAVPVRVPNIGEIHG